MAKQDQGHHSLCTPSPYGYCGNNKFSSKFLAIALHLLQQLITPSSGSCLLCTGPCQS